MTPELPGGAVVTRLRREAGRAAARARNGLRYAAGRDFTTPQPTPRDQVWNQGKVTLWRYRSDDVRFAPPVLVFIGLVSRPALFDLHERASLVRALRDAGFDVFVLDWGVADAGDAGNTFETYLCRYLPRAVRAVRDASGADSVTMAGYCMGGNMALLATAGLPDLGVRNLVTFATAVDLHRLGDQFAPLRERRQDVSALTDDSGNLPGDLIAGMFRVRKPTAGLVQRLNLWENLPDERYVAGHQAIERWTRDHVPLPGAAAQQAVDNWLRENAFMTGRLVLDGRRVDLRAVTCPVLAILCLRDEVVPAAAAAPIGDLLGSADFTLLELDAGHIGLAVGRSAHAVMYPRLTEWLRAHSDEVGA